MIDGKKNWKDPNLKTMSQMKLYKAIWDKREITAPYSYLTKVMAIAKSTRPKKSVGDPRREKMLKE